MNTILKCTLITILLSTSGTFYAASSEKIEKTSSTQKYYSIHYAILKNDVDAVKQFIKDGADVNATGVNGRIPLDLAVFAKSPEIVQTLLIAHANPNIIFTPIYASGAAANKTTVLRRLYVLMKRNLHFPNTTQELTGIARAIIKAGGTCPPKDQFLSQHSNHRVAKIIAEIEAEIAQEKQSSAETQKAAEMFANPDLRRPLPKAIIQGPIAEYLGVPISEQQKAREALEEEKERAAEEAARAAQTTSTPAAKTDAKSLDDVD